MLIHLNATMMPGLERSVEHGRPGARLSRGFEWTGVLQLRRAMAIVIATAATTTVAAAMTNAPGIPRAWILT